MQRSTYCSRQHFLKIRLATPATIAGSRYIPHIGLLVTVYGPLSFETSSASARPHARLLPSASTCLHARGGVVPNRDSPAALGPSPASLDVGRANSSASLAVAVRRARGRTQSRRGCDPTNSAKPADGRQPLRSTADRHLRPRALASGDESRHRVRLDDTFNCALRFALGVQRCPRAATLVANLVKGKASRSQAIFANQFRCALGGEIDPHEVDSQSLAHREEG
jgi:hypothetical protein